MDAVAIAIAPVPSPFKIDGLSSTLDEGHPRYGGWRVVFACGVGALCASAPYQSFAVFLRPMSEEFGWTREAAAAAYGAMTLLAAAAAAPVGHLLDRRGVRQIAIPALAMVGVMVASLALLTPSLQHFYLISAAIGLATIGASPVAYSRAIFSWFDVRRGRALGLMLAGAATAAIMMPPLAARLIATMGWRRAWVAIGVMIIAVGVPITAAWLRERDDGTRRLAAPRDGATVGEALRSRLFWTLIAVLFLSGLLITGFIVHGAALLSDRGFTPAQAALVVSAFGAGNLAGRLLAGTLLDRYSAPRLSAGLLMVSAAGGLLLVDAHAMPIAIAAAVLIGLGAGGEMDINPYLISRYFGMRSLSTLYGFNWMSLGVASAAGPILMGRAFDTTRGYGPMLVQLALVTIGAAALMLTLPAPERRPHAVAAVD